MFFLFLVVVLVNAQNAPCVSNGKVLPNICADYPNYPMCVQTDEGYKCSECIVNCDCKELNTFCHRGKCMTAVELGRPCISLPHYYNEGSKSIGFPTKKVDNHLFCGLVTTSNTYEWIGYCNHGICGSCIPEFSTQYLAKYEKSFYDKNWDKTLMCPGCKCLNNSVVLSEHKLNTYADKYVDPYFGFLLIITILLVVTCLLLMIHIFCQNKKSK